MPSDNNTIKSFWTDPKTYATALVALGIHEFGTDIFNLEPETIEEELRHRYGVGVPSVNKDKLFALLTALGTDMFYQSITCFTHIANALNGSTIQFNTFDPVTPDEIAWATTEVTLNDPPNNDEDLSARYSPDLRRYIGSILDVSGFTIPPKYLKVVADMPVTKTTTMPDDHAMLQAQTINQSDRAKENETYVKGKLSELVSQLNILKPLVTPSAEEKN